MQSAAKVGLLVIIFVALLLGAYATLGKSLFAPKTDTYYAIFEDASGVAVASPVLMAGVKVGSVSAVELAGPREAKITIALKEGVPVPTDSVASIATPLIGLGESPFTIVPPAVSHGVLPPGSTLRGVKKGALDNILPNSKETVAELNKTLAAVRKLLEDKDLMDRTKKLLANSDRTIKEFGDLAHSSNALLASNQATIHNALSNANLALHDVHRVTDQVAKLLESGSLQKDTKGLLAQLKDVTKSADKLVNSLNDLVNDPQIRGPVNQTAANVASITETGKAIAENTKEITNQGVEISKNVKTVSEKAIPLMDNANEVMVKASKLEDKLGESLDKVGNFFNRGQVSNPFERATYKMDLMRQSNPGYWRTDFGIEYPIPDGAIYAGLYDAFGSDKLTLQLGKNLSPKLSYRYGIYAAQPGVGVDFQVAPRLSLHGEIWDLNRLRVDLRARYDFGNGIVGWLGVDQAFGHSSPTIGIGIRR